MVLTVYFHGAYMYAEHIMLRNTDMGRHGKIQNILAKNSNMYACINLHRPQSVQVMNVPRIPCQE